MKTAMVMSLEEFVTVLNSELPTERGQILVERNEKNKWVAHEFLGFRDGNAELSERMIGPEMEIIIK